MNNQKQPESAADAVENDETLECPMCGAADSFTIDPMNPARRFCSAEDLTWTITPTPLLQQIQFVRSHKQPESVPQLKRFHLSGTADYFWETQIDAESEQEAREAVKTLIKNNQIQNDRFSFIFIQSCDEEKGVFEDK